jgi:cyclopropane-fatty-acyl-phospholipid synthase
VFAPDLQFDRVVFVEMFEHMSNWCEWMTRVRAWRSIAPMARTESRNISLPAA